jgi:hypothetical protein
LDPTGFGHREKWVQSRRPDLVRLKLADDINTKLALRFLDLLAAKRPRFAAPHAERSEQKASVNNAL